MRVGAQRAHQRAQALVPQIALRNIQLRQRGRVGRHQRAERGAGDVVRFHVVVAIDPQPIEVQYAQAGVCHQRAEQLRRASRVAPQLWSAKSQRRERRVAAQCITEKGTRVRVQRPLLLLRRIVERFAGIAVMLGCRSTAALRCL